MTLQHELLSKYVKVIGGFAFKSEHFSTDGIPVIRISDIQGGNVSIEKAALIPKAQVGKGERYNIEAGDILIAMSGATTGKIGLVPDNFCGLVLQNQRVGNFKVTAPEKLHKGYLKHYVNSPFYQSKIFNTMAGAAQPNISSKQLEDIEIPLPLLPEQTRIAAILDQANALRLKRMESLAQLDSLSQAIFIEMFGDPVTNQFNFPLVPIVELVSKGRSKLILSDGDVWNLNLDQIEPNTGRVLQKVQVTADKLGTSTFAFQAGTVLYSKLRPYLNKVVVADADGFATTELVPLNCIETLIKPAFLAYFLRSKRFVDFATETVAGAKMPRMIMDAFWSYKLPLPPTSLQVSFNEKIILIEKQRAMQLEQFAELDTLFSSLQHRAFSGEL